MILKVTEEKEWNRLEIAFQNGRQVLLQDDILLGYVKRLIPLKGAVWIKYLPVPKQVEEKDGIEYRKALILVAVSETEDFSYTILFVINPEGKLELYDSEITISEVHLKVGEPVSYIEWKNQVPIERKANGILTRILTTESWERK